jgi:ribosomal protein S18 acetylase RimI-like enzyme
MSAMWGFARDAYTPVEMQFLCAFPEVVGTEQYFKPFEPLFAHGVANVDWNAATKTMESILQGHFVFDPTQLPQNVIAMFSQDTCFMVIAKERTTGKPLGFITFLMRATYAAGDVKVMSLAVDTTHQNRGLGKLLMSSIFKITPDIKRIFLCTRVTNDTALQAYRSWGFVTDNNPILDHAFNLTHWSFIEYITEQSDILQKTASNLIE